MIIDSHVHLSTYAHEGLSFARIRDSLLASMHRNGISVSIVYPDSEPDTVVSDLDTTLSLVRGQSRLHLVGTAFIDSLDGKMVEKLTALAAEGVICGIKLYPGFETFYPDDPRCEPLYELCVRYDLPVVLHSGKTMNDPERLKYNHPHAIEKLARRVPQLRIVVAHFSQPALAECHDLVLAYSNVHVDISGLADPSVTDICATETIASVLMRVVTKRPEGVLFATDWPLCDVGAHIAMVRSLPVDDTVKEGVLWRNAERVFRCQWT
jgi:predicted TIM-barrel fold metal-dependent hydrolase